MTEKKKGFSTGFGKINKVKSKTVQTPEKPKKSKPVKEEAKSLPKKKQGRPSTKEPDKNYVRVTATIPEAVRDAMKVALYSTFKEVHKTQDDFVSAAVEFYIQNYGGEKVLENNNQD